MAATSPANDKPTTLHLVPTPAGVAVPKLHQFHQRQIVAIESDVIEASCELVYQRDDLAEALRHDREHDAALEAALRVEGLPPLARELIQRAQAADDAEDAAVYERAGRRGQNAHGHTRSAAGRAESLLTGRAP